MRKAQWVIIVGALAFIAGCSGAIDPAGIATPINSLSSSTVTLTVPPDDGLLPRWMDVADTPYTTDSDGLPFTGAFDYSKAHVTAALATSADGLMVTLSGSGLKPNFAYQIKLEGQPAVDPAANQILGDLGRWWNDLGYLIPGYLVTDASGSVTYTASSKVWPDAATRIDSSYHVLWKTSQRRPARFDGPVINHSVVQTLWGYDAEQAGATVGVYAEQEAGRPRPGKLVLPDGSYQCLLRLTEEAFHMKDSSGMMVYGWKTILDAPISFTIGSETPEPPSSSTGTIAGAVRYESGAVARKVPVTLTSDGGQISTAKTLGNGAYSFANVATNAAYTVSATDGSRSAEVAGVTVAAGATTTVNLTLQ